MDSAQAKSAVAGVEKDHLDAEKIKKEHMKRIAQVSVSAEDVATIMHELELTKKQATQMLKENDGSIEKTIDAFLSS